MIKSFTFQQDQVPVPKSSRRRPAEDEDADAAQKTDDGENVNESKRAEDSQRSKAGGSTLMREGGENSQTSVQQKAKVQRRTPCPYGTSCYRYQSKPNTYSFIYLFISEVFSM